MKHIRLFIISVMDGIDTGFTGLAQATLNGEDGWFYFQNGMWDQYPDTSLAEYGGSWWYIADGGKIDFNYNGTAYFNDVEWYVEGGRVDFSLPEEQKAIRWLLMGWKFRSRLIL